MEERTVLPFRFELEDASEVWGTFKAQLKKDVHIMLTSKKTRLYAKKGETVTLRGYTGATLVKRVSQRETYCDLSIIKENKCVTVWFETTGSPFDYFIEDLLEIPEELAKAMSYRRKVYLGKEEIEVPEYETLIPYELER